MISQAKNSGRRSSTLAAVIRQAITIRKFQPGCYLPSVRELSETYGLAGETVRRALKALEAEGALRAAPRQGYRVVADEGAREGGLPVAYLAYEPEGGKHFWDNFHQTLLVRFQDTASARGMALLTTRWNESHRERVFDQLISARVTGAILDKQDPELLDLLHKAGIAPVLVDSWYEEPRADMVAQDGFSGGVQAAEYLIGQGHRRVVMLGPVPQEGDLQIAERYGGVAAALRRHGLDLTSDCIVHAPLNDPAAAQAAAGALLSRPDRPGAILALWQDMVHAVIDAAAERGLVPGRDFAMVGWSTEEDYADGYARRFGRGPAPAAIVWSMDRMVEMAMRCIRVRRMEPDASPLPVRVPVRLRLET